MKHRLMLAIAVLLVLACAVTPPLRSQVSSVIVSVHRGGTISWDSFSLDQVVEREGNPTAQQIQDFKDGTLHLIRFTSTSPALTKALNSFTDCADAINTVCTTINEEAIQGGGEEDCRGRCTNRVVIRIVPE